MASYTSNLNLYKPDATDDYGDFREEFNENMDKIDQGGGNQNIATNYDDTQTYVVGDYVIYDGLLYKCDTAVTTAETFDPTKWTHVVVTDEMGSGGGSGGHTIYDKDGTALAQESGLQFTGAVSVSDDSVNGRTVIDVEGGGNYYLNTIYSTEEKKVGYWTDGKPLYQKTWDLGSDLLIDSNTWTSTSIRVSDFNIENIIHASGLNSGGTFFGFVATNRDQSYVQILQTRNAQITIRYFTLRYTKTTDTPELNPQIGNVIYLPTIYSEEERQVGVWTDGKPLYQKTTDLGSVSANSSVDITVGIGTGVVETVVNISVIGNYATTFWQPLPFPLPSNISSYSAYIDGYKTYSDKIGIKTGSDRDFTKLFCTIQYTKTTDTAGSGIWNGQGGYAHHYSTSETVVGTWIDGKTLYEKTLDCGYGVPSGGSLIQPIGVSDIAEIINWNVWSTNGAFSRLFPYVNDTGSVRVDVDINNGNIRLYPMGISLADQKVYAVLQYTKTTD